MECWIAAAAPRWGSLNPPGHKSSAAREARKAVGCYTAVPPAGPAQRACSAPHAARIHERRRRRWGCLWCLLTTPSTHSHPAPARPPAPPPPPCRHGGASAGGNLGAAAAGPLLDERHQRAALPVRPHRAPPAHRRVHPRPHAGLHAAHLRHHRCGKLCSGGWEDTWGVGQGRTLQQRGDRGETRLQEGGVQARVLRTGVLTQRILPVLASTFLPPLL